MSDLLTGKDPEVVLAELNVSLSQQKLNRDSTALRRIQIKTELARLEKNDAVIATTITQIEESIKQIQAIVEAAVANTSNPADSTNN